MQLSVDADNGRFHQCLALAAKMKVEGINPDILTYNALLLACSRVGLSLEAWAIFDDMTLMGIRPDRSSFHHLLNVTVQQSVNACNDRITNFLLYP
jgi:pentatricopeptide repeat protein